MTLETKTDSELIELWTQISRNLNKEKTNKPSKGTRQLEFMSQIHTELTKRGYVARQSLWVKNDTAKHE